MGLVQFVLRWFGYLRPPPPTTPHRMNLIAAPHLEPPPTDNPAELGSWAIQECERMARYAADGAQNVYVETNVGGDAVPALLGVTWNILVAEQRIPATPPMPNVCTIRRISSR